MQMWSNVMFPTYLHHLYYMQKSTISSSDHKMHNWSGLLHESALLYYKPQECDLAGCGQMIANHAQPCPACDQNLPGSPFLIFKGRGEPGSRLPCGSVALGFPVGVVPSLRSNALHCD